MDGLQVMLGDIVANDAELVQALDNWASEVLQCRADALGLSETIGSESRALDHFFGSVVARDRLERLVSRADLYLVAAVDALFVSFTEEVGSDWTVLTGLESMSSESWWWGRVPSSGPVREEFDRLSDEGVLDRLLGKN